MSQAGAPTARWTAVGGPALLSFLLALTGTTLAWALLPRPTPGAGKTALSGRAVIPAAAFALTALTTSIGAYVDHVTAGIAATRDKLQKLIRVWIQKNCNGMGAPIFLG